jgi:hypothetical protein
MPHRYNAHSNSHCNEIPPPHKRAITHKVLKEDDEDWVKALIPRYHEVIMNQGQSTHGTGCVYWGIIIRNKNLQWFRKGND